MTAQPARVSVSSVWPAPSPAEVVAIVAAVQAVWPRPAETAALEPEGRNAWRFSGRWWSRPSTARRDRPWVHR